MGNKKKWIKGDYSGHTCMLCLEQQNVFDLNKKAADIIQEVLTIKVDNVIKLPKRVCYRCYFIVEYMRDFRNVTIRNITVAENKIFEDSSSLTYDKPRIFNIITEQVLREENIPWIIENEHETSKDAFVDDDDVLLVPNSYRDAGSYEEDVPFKQSIFQCRHCIKTYTKKTSLALHEKKHQREERKSRCSSVSGKSKSFSCQDCDTETVFSSVTDFRRHKKTHISTMVCRLGCGVSFNATFERDCHESVCDQRFTSEEMQETGVRTRSRSRLGSIARSTCSSRYNSDDESNCDSVSTRVEKKERNSRQNKRREIISTRSVDSSQESTAVRRSEPIKRKTHSRRANNKNQSYGINVTLGVNAGSQIEIMTTYQKPDNYMPMISNSPLCVAVDDLNADEPQGYQPKSTYESIGRFTQTHRAQSLSVFACSLKGCRFKGAIDQVSKHETIQHNVQPWYKCNECRKVYTKGIFLEHHKLISHTTRPLGCYFCAEIHLTQVDLRRHLLKHRHSENVPCRACDKQFLTIEALRVHLDGEEDERHSLFKSAYGYANLKLESDVIEIEDTAVSDYAYHDPEVYTKTAVNSESDALVTFNVESEEEIGNSESEDDATNSDFRIEEVKSLSTGSRPNTPFSSAYEDDDTSEYDEDDATAGNNDNGIEIWDST